VDLIADWDAAFTTMTRGLPATRVAGACVQFPQANRASAGAGPCATGAPCAWVHFPHPCGSRDERVRAVLLAKDGRTHARCRAFGVRKRAVRDAAGTHRGKPENDAAKMGVFAAKT